MIKRSAQNKLQELASAFKAVVVTGPRQSGKTTLVKELFTVKEKNVERKTLVLKVEKMKQWVFKDQITSSLSLFGPWHSEAGFIPGDFVEVTVDKNLLILRRIKKG